MSNEDILKLLGGYATNTLTESERKALFAAALEDQKLFNALQEEEALKELLSDAASRAQIRQALEEPRRRAWWSPGWVWGGALAAAAAVVIVALVTIHPFERLSPVQVASSSGASREIAPEPPPAPPVTSQPEAPKQKLAERIVRARSLAAPAPAPPNPQLVAPRAMTASKALLSQDRIAIGTGSAGTVSGSLSLLLRYSLVKREASGTDTPVSEAELKPGDIVRISVSVGMPGSLALFERDASGDLRQVFPAAGQSATVAANSSFTIDWPIAIAPSAETFRLTLSPADLQTDKGVEVAKKQTPAPLALDIQIGPKN